MNNKSALRTAKNALQHAAITYRKPLLAAGFIAASALAFWMLPPVAATLASGFIGLGGYAVYERKRRLFWEQSLNFKLLNMDKRQSKLVDALSRTTTLSDTGPAHYTPSAPFKPAVPDPELDLSRRPLTRNSRRYDQIVCNEDIIMDDIDRDIRASRPMHVNASASPKPKKDDGNTIVKFSGMATAKAPKPQKPAAKKQKNNIYYSDSLIKEFIENALKKKKIQILQQPVMELPQRQARFYMLRAAIETYGGKYLTEADYMKVAKANKLEGKITTLLLNHTINKIAQGSAVNYIIPVRSETFQSAAFMNSLLAYYKASPQHAKQLTFALDYNDFEAMAPANLQVMRMLTRLQCRFMLTGISSANLDIDLLHALNIKMLSVPAAFVSEKMKTPAGFHDMISIRRTLESHSLRVIVDGIDTAAMLESFSSFAPRYGVGEYFSESEANAQTQQPLLYGN